MMAGFLVLCGKMDEACTWQIWLFYYVFWLMRFHFSLHRHNQHKGERPLLFCRSQRILLCWGIKDSLNKENFLKDFLETVIENCC